MMYQKVSKNESIALLLKSSLVRDRDKKISWCQAILQQMMTIGCLSLLDFTKWLCFKIERCGSILFHIQDVIATYICLMIKTCKDRRLHPATCNLMTKHLVLVLSCNEPRRSLYKLWCYFIMLKHFTRDGYINDH